MSFKNSLSFLSRLIKNAPLILLLVMAFNPAAQAAFEKNDTKVVVTPDHFVLVWKNEKKYGVDFSVTSTSQLQVCTNTTCSAEAIAAGAQYFKVFTNVPGFQSVTVFYRQEGSKLVIIGTYEIAIPPPKTYGGYAYTSAGNVNKNPKPWVNTIGKIAGADGVNLLGQATYSMPLRLPPAYAGLKLPLAFTHTGSGNDGYLGKAWTLQGLDAVTRCEATWGSHRYSAPIKMTASDQICLGGEKLKLIAGSQGADGSEYRFEIDNGIKIVAKGSGQQYVFYAKDGTQYHYGWSASGLSALTVNGHKLNHAWPLTAITDLSGNTININYDVLGDNTYYPSSISYNGNPSKGVAATTIVNFSYANRPDVLATHNSSIPHGYYKSYGGQTFQSNRLLTGVQVSVAGSSVSKYSLYYKKAAITGEYRLAELYYCGLSSGIECVSPTSFSYSPASITTFSTASASYQKVLRRSMPSGYLLSNVAWRPSKASLLYIHADAGQANSIYLGGAIPGDLYEYYFDSNKAHTRKVPVYISDGSGGAKEIKLASLSHARSIDLDKDGTDELIVPKDYTQGAGVMSNGYSYWQHEVGPLTWIVFKNVNGSYYQMTTFQTKPFLIGQYFDSKNGGYIDQLIQQPFVVISEALGDEVPDIYFKNYSDGEIKRIFWSDSTNSYYKSSTGGMFSGVPFGAVDGGSKPIVADFNNDRVSDYLVTLKSGANRHKLILSQSDKTYAGKNVSHLSQGARSVFDVNKDGLMDIVSLHGAYTGTSSTDLLYWWVGINKGNGVFDWQNTLIGMNESDSQATVFIDLDGDGVKDFVKPNGIAYLLKSVVKNGKPKVEWLQVTGPAFSSAKSTARCFFADCRNNSPVVADFNGDSISDLVYFSIAKQQSTGTPAEGDLRLLLNGGKKGGELLQIRDGVQNTTSYKYNPIGHIVGRSGYPVETVTPSWPTVSTVNYSHTGAPGYKKNYKYGRERRSSWGGGKYTNELLYRDIYHNKFLGFEDVVVTDSRDGSVTDTSRAKSYPEAVDWSYREKKVGGNTITQSRSYQYTWDLARWKRSKWVDIDSDNHSNYHVRADYKSDSFLNVNEETTRTWFGSGGGGTVFNEISVRDYVEHKDESSWRVGFMSKELLLRTSTDGHIFGDLTGKTICDEAGLYSDETKYTPHGNTSLVAKAEVSSRFETKASGCIYSETAAHSLLTTSVFERDVSIVKTGAVTAQKVTTLDGKGGVLAQRVIESSTGFSNAYLPESVSNALGQARTVKYDAATGQQSELTLPNGLKTTTQYDALGRVKEVQGADGVVSSHFYLGASAASVCPTTAAYALKVVTSKLGQKLSPDSYTCYDGLDREVRSAAKAGFGGDSIYRDTLYDVRGNVFKTSAPYFASTTPLYTSYTYDVKSRVLTVARPDGSAVVNGYVYDNTSGLLVTTNTETVIAPGGSQKTIVSKKHENAIGQIVRQQEAVGSPEQTDTLYKYDPKGNLRQVTRDGNIVTKMEYDLFGNRSKLEDPDSGVTAYKYDGYNQLVEQLDEAGRKIALEYDMIGRLFERKDYLADGTTVESTGNWVYDTAVLGTTGRKNIGALHTRSTSDYTETNHYDDLARISSVDTDISGLGSRTLAQSYDGLGRLDVQSYPGGFDVKSHYNSEGALDKLTNTAGDVKYWQADAQDAWGNITQFKLANGLISSTQSFDAKRGWLQSIISIGAGSSNLQNLAYKYNSRGTLRERKSTSGAENLVEGFIYDAQDRLKTATTAGLASGARVQSYTYSLLGNIETKTDVGTYSYGANNAGPHAVTGVLKDGITTSYGYDLVGNMISGAGRAIEYSVFNKPLTISKGSTLTDAFKYGPDRTRFYQKLTKDSNVTETYYLPGYEEIKEGDKTTRKIFAGDLIHTEIQASTGAPWTTKNEYTLRDHLGSPESVVSDTGVRADRMQFDAFGSRRASNWESTLTAAAVATAREVTTRGFTGHEHLDDVGIVHMNGRIYDPVLGRFLNVDIPAAKLRTAYMSQGWNSYSYVLNNPFKYTDPSGYYLLSSDVNLTVVNGLGLQSGVGFFFTDTPNAGDILPYDFGVFEFVEGATGLDDSVGVNVDVRRFGRKEFDGISQPVEFDVQLVAGASAGPIMSEGYVLGGSWKHFFDNFYGVTFGLEISAPFEPLVSGTVGKTIQSNSYSINDGLNFMKQKIETFEQFLHSGYH